MPAHLKRAAELGLSAVTVEGALIAPAELSRIAATPSDQKSAADYGCPKGTTLKDEIARYFRIGQALWQGYSRIEAPTIQQTADFAKAQLEGVFGFSSLAGPVEHQKDGHRYRIAWEAKGGRVPVVCTAPTGDEDGFKRALAEYGDGQAGPMPRRSPATLLQEWLNANPDFYWGLVFAGDRLRLMRDNASLTRPAWIEADLGAIYRDEMFADFTGVWLLIHASRFGAEGAAAADCALERWREDGLRAGTAVRDKLRGSVEDALTLLGQGFLDANPELRERLGDGRLSITSWFEQLLRLVYRMIFLGVAEDRDLLHAPDAKRDVKQLYAENYGFSYLRDRSARRQGRGRHADAYEGAKIVFRALVHGEKLLGLPALGGLFAPGLSPDLDDAALENRAFLAAVFKLAWLIGANGRERINWRDMATEELGSVYEGLLELVPIIEGGTTFAFAGGAEAKGNARKVSGSYYTPDSLVQTLLDSALDPVLDQAEAEGGAEAILDLNVIDPACGSGHFLLGAARRMANRVAQIRDPDAPDYQAAMRDVVRRCIHGVDRNPMAVELAKVALWIEAIEPGKPLGFLDANIRCGDSLLGVFDLAALEEGIPDDAYKALTGDEKSTANFYKARNKAEKKGQGSFDWSSGGGSLPPKRIAASQSDVLELPEDTVEQVTAKQKKFEAWRHDPRRQNTKVACDLYVAAFLLPKTGGPPPNGNMGLVPTTADIRTKLGGGNVFGPREAAAVDAAAEARAFHWPLVFPDVLIARGGFDLVIGNPPWERIKLKEQEFFARRAPEIAAATNAAARGQMIKALEEAGEDSPEQRLYNAFQLAKRIAEASSLFFTAPKDEDPVKGVMPTAARRYPWTGRGDVNTYALFAEHFLNLTRRSGRAGVIVPTGIATDLTTAPYFDFLMREARLISLLGFENEEFLFPEVHNATKFALLTIGNLSASGGKADFAFLLRQVAQNDDVRRHFQASVADIKLVNPISRTAPIFRSRADAEFALKLHSRLPILWSEQADANDWQISFMTMFHMANDSDQFLSKSQITTAYPDTKPKGLVPLYEGKMFHFFNHRHGTYQDFDLAPGKMVKELPPPSSEELQDPAFDIEPRYWVDRSAQRQRKADARWTREWFFGWRNITGPTVYRSMICAILPDAAVGHATPLLMCGLAPEFTAVLSAGFSSLVFDYLVRLKLGGNNLTYSVLRQIPFPSPTSFTEADLDFIVPRVLELSYTSHSLAPFARDLGYDGAPFAWDEERRAQLRAELDAFFALAYGLSRDELRYVLDPKAVMGADYPSETFRVLQNNERKKYHEYRTERLVLAAYDQLVCGGRSPQMEGWR